MFDIIEDAKELACLAGSGGILWSDIAAQLSIARRSPIATHVLQRFRQCNYSIEPKLSSPNESPTSSSDPFSPDEDDLLITVSEEAMCRAIGKSRQTQGVVILL